MSVKSRKESWKKLLKNFLKTLFFLPPILTLLISLPAYVFVIYTLTSEDVNPMLAYISYIWSAYAFVISITGIKGIVILIRQTIKQNHFIKKMLSVPLIDKYRTEDWFRVKTGLYQSFCINLFYAGIKLISGIYYRSVWFITLAVYYALLAVMRFMFLHHLKKEKIIDIAGKNKNSEWQQYRLCGIILLFMNVALVGMVLLVIQQNGGFEYPELVVYIMALYTFYTMITAVWNVIKFKKYGSPVLSATKGISLTAAIVSMFALETAMLTQFGSEEEAEFRTLMTTLTGTGVSIFVFGMAVFMIISATKHLRKTL